MQGISSLGRVIGFCALMLSAPMAMADGACVEPGAVVAWVPQQEGWVVGSIGGKVVGTSCSYDLPVTKGWTIRLMPEGPVKLSIAAIGYSRIDPLQPFQAKADGTIKIVVTRTTTRGADFTYKLVMDLRKPGL